MKNKTLNEIYKEALYRIITACESEISIEHKREPNNPLIGTLGAIKTIAKSALKSGKTR